LLIELGLLLIVVPWSAFWERNYFSQLSPVLYAVLTNNYVRGAITGLGAVNVLAALADLSLLVRRRPAP
jgi:hypothetical protein